MYANLTHNKCPGTNLEHSSSGSRGDLTYIGVALAGVSVYALGTRPFRLRLTAGRRAVGRQGRAGEHVLRFQ